MKVLITGATGFIGSHLLESLKKDTTVVAIYTTSRNRDIPLSSRHTHHFKVDLANQSEVAQLFSVCQPDVIYHLAANPVPRLDPKNINAHLRDISATHNLVHYSPEDCKIVYASTIVVYGDNAIGCYEQTEKKPTTVYGLSKLSCENILEIYRRQYKKTYIALRLVATIGNKATHGVIPDLIRKAQLESDVLEVWGDCPGSSKPYMHIDDTVAAIIHCARFNYPYVINIAPHDTMSIEEIADMVRYHHDRSKQLVWLGEKANFAGDNKVISSHSRLLIDSGFRFKYPKSLLAVEQAVKEYL
jgi:UDP-glucose 4-epimerase